MSSHITAQWILLLSRVVLSVIMIHYGWPKVRDLKSNANDFVHMGFKPGMFWGTLIALVEFLGGIAILLGLYAELAAALFAFEMMVGMFWKLKIKKPFSDYAYDIQLFALCLVVMSQGAGAYARLRGMPIGPGPLRQKGDGADSGPSAACRGGRRAPARRSAARAPTAVRPTTG